jgi:predicted transglutaminase-like cysteine proteinase
MIANVIFCYIYVSAIRKFRTKQDGYKAENKALTKANVKLLNRINEEHNESAEVINNMILRGQKQVAALELLRESMVEVDNVA